MRKYISIRLVPLLIVMGTIFYLSHLPGDSLPIPRFKHNDKVAHTLAYGVLALSFIHAFKSQLVAASTTRAISSIVAFCFVYGLSDEFHQSFVPLRSVSVWDVTADIVGAVIAASLWLFWMRKRRASSSS